MNTISSQISISLQLNEQQVNNTLTLFSEGCTIPFIARYRKEMTGGLDEVQIASIEEEKKRFDDLTKRRSSIEKSLNERGLLSDELKQKIQSATTLVKLEDIYLPHKPKRKTKAEKAREKGLEGLAKIIMSQQDNTPNDRASRFVKGEVKSEEEALQGARDIIAEWISENESTRERLRTNFQRHSIMSAKVIKGKEEAGEKYRDYFKWDEPITKAPSHRVLALMRAEQEGILRLNIQPEQERNIEQINRYFIKNNSNSAQEVELAIKDAYKRLLSPSLETEIRHKIKEKADDSSILVFEENLKQLLLTAPLGEKRILGIDPGFKSGCKLVCLDEQGNLLHNETIFPHPPQKQDSLSIKKISTLVDSYNIEAIAIGNGTASRETERIVKRVHFNRDIQVFIVNEAGASIYSASKIARDEFPQFDVTVRGSVSIGRRLMDPLAELVKIEPKSIGVGQYQHDVDQNKLTEKLQRVVEHAVNAVGVDANTASSHLLQYISGLGPQLAKNIIEFRKENGAFSSRKELLKVPRMGKKAYEQAAGFIRITDGSELLDNTAVHPESYSLVKKMAKDLNIPLESLIRNETEIDKINIKNYVSDEVGEYTLNDVISELKKPARDPRKKARSFEFDKNLNTIKDLTVGAEIHGIVNNLTNFGAFIDIGIKENGLVHISQITDRFISNAVEALRLGQYVRVKVLEVDIQRKRIQLTMKGIKQIDEK